MKVLFLSDNKEKWDESFSRARATRKKQKLRAPPPLPIPTRFTRTGGASVAVFAERGRKRPPPWTVPAHGIFLAPLP